MFGRDKQATPPTAAPTAPNQTYASPVAAVKPGAPPNASKMETIIGANCQMSGVMKSDGGIRIEGIFDGQIQTAGNLVIAESAKVLADIQAFNIVVSGTVKGNITANKLEVTETGRVFGDLNINSLMLAEGAYMRGQTNMTGDVEPPMIEAPRVAPVRPALAEIEAPKA